MSTLREQITACVAEALTGTTPAGANVFRSREIGITRAQVPAIVVRPEGEQDTRMGTSEKHQFTIALEILVRGDPWDTLADAVAEPLHRVLMTDTQLQSLAVDVRRTSTDYEGQEADKTAGTLTSRYLITYLSRATDLSLQP